MWGDNMVYGIVIGVIIVIILILSIYMNTQIMNPKTWSHEEAFIRELELDLFDSEEHESYNKDVIQIESNYGYKLYGEYYGGVSDNTVIICHGFGYNLVGSIKYIKMFRDLGFNTLIYDHRNHGNSGGGNTTFGYIEKRDLAKWVDWIVEQNPNGKIGTHGVSMGGATVIQHAAIDKRISFTIADCAYQSAYKEIIYRIKKDYSFLAYPLVYVSSIISLLRGGGLYSQISPIAVINDFAAPILFIHGNEDKYVQTIHTLNMYNKRLSNKELYIVENATHGKAYETNITKYKEIVNEFLMQYNILGK